MKPQEYRVGNLVKSGKGIYKIFANSLPQILAIQKYDEPDESQSKVYPTEGTILEPIPITEEWLIKFGFDLVVKEGNQGEFRVYQLNEITYNTNHGWWWKNNLTVQPKYVHQLQNLYFALTGKELTLKP